MLVRSIDERIARLERIVSPAVVAPNVIVPKGDPLATVIGGLRGHQKAFQRALQDKPGLSAFFDRYVEVERLLVSRQVMPGVLPPVDTAVLQEMVLASETELLDAADDLKDIETLQTHVDIPILKDLPQLQATLAQNEMTEREYMDRIGRLYAQFQDTLAEYNHFVSDVSELFVQFHRTLSDLEQEDEDARASASTSALQ
ncbi:hypothetical protein BC831DRAFT_437205 [Entophlyctis helioformis]|nr:hypothetical protein BC831DRAFT_437205 [Entophlyctis helioformis]